MKKKLAVIAVVLCVLVAGGVYAKNQIAIKTAQMQKSQFATAPVKRGNMDVTVSGTASIVPLEKTTVKASIAGTVERLFIEEGQPVREGQPVLLVSNAQLVQALEQAQLDHESQQHKLQTLKSPSDVDRAQAESHVQLAQQTLDNRKKDIEKLSISSPITGRVASVKVNPGDLISVAQVLISVVDDTVVHVQAQIPQIEIAKVKVGQTVSLGFGSELPAAQGVVDSIGVEASGSNLSTTHVPVSIKVNNESGVYRIGLNANATIKVGSDESVTGSGQVTAKARYDIRAEVGGTAEAVLVRDNDTVKASQLLVKIKNDNALVAMRQAEADLKLAQDNLSKIQSGLVPNISADDTKQQEFRVRQSSLAVQSRSVDVSYLEPKAPFDGTIVARHVTRGDTVAPGSPLFTVADYSKMKMVISVDELDVARVRPGQKATVRVEAVGRSYEGLVTKVAAEGTVKDGVASYPVEVTLSDTKDLKGSMSGTAKIQVADRQNTLLVPSEAIWTENDRTTVIVLKDDKPVHIDVKVGLTSTTNTEILSGINEGDHVVLSSIADMSYFTTGTGSAKPKDETKKDSPAEPKTK